MILAKVFRTVAAQYFLSEKGQRIRRMSATLYEYIYLYWSEKNIKATFFSLPIFLSSPFVINRSFIFLPLSFEKNH